MHNVFAFLVHAKNTTNIDNGEFITIILGYLDTCIFKPTEAAGVGLSGIRKPYLCNAVTGRNEAASGKQNSATVSGLCNA